MAESLTQSTQTRRRTRAVSILTAVLGLLMSLLVAAPASAVDDRDWAEPIHAGGSAHGNRASIVSGGDVWPSSNIPVCWEAHEDTEINTDGKALLEEVIEDSWEAVSNVDFTGWGDCNASSQGVRLLIDAVRPHAKAIGANLDGLQDGLVLNFSGENFAPGCSDNESTFRFCVRTFGVNLFGNAMGFATNGGADDPLCEEEPAGDTINITAFDPESVMNYCGTRERFNAGDLTALDVAAARALYGPYTPEVPVTYRIDIDMNIVDAELFGGDEVGSPSFTDTVAVFSTDLTTRQWSACVGGEVRVDFELGYRIVPETARAGFSALVWLYEGTSCGTTDSEDLDGEGDSIALFAGEPFEWDFFLVNEVLGTPADTAEVHVELTPLMEIPLSSAGAGFCSICEELAADLAPIDTFELPDIPAPDPFNPGACIANCGGGITLPPLPSPIQPVLPIIPTLPGPTLPGPPIIGPTFPGVPTPPPSGPVLAPTPIFTVVPPGPVTIQCVPGIGPCSGASGNDGQCVVTVDCAELQVAGCIPGATCADDLNPEPVSVVLPFIEDDPDIEPTEPVPGEPVPTEPEPTEPEPTEPLPGEPVPTEPNQAGPNPPKQKMCLGKVVTVDLSLGQAPTNGDDVILGTNGPDTINGLKGNDLICGLKGDDFIQGGSGKDRINGGNGNDVLQGNRGNDRVVGSGGNDKITGGGGNDKLFGQKGKDTLSGEKGKKDLCNGGGGNDTATNSCEVIKSIP